MGFPSHFCLSVSLYTFILLTNKSPYRWHLSMGQQSPAQHGPSLMAWRTYCWFCVSDRRKFRFVDHQQTNCHLYFSAQLRDRKLGKHDFGSQGSEGFRFWGASSYASLHSLSRGFLSTPWCCSVLVLLPFHIISFYHTK